MTSLAILSPCAEVQIVSLPTYIAGSFFRAKYTANVTQGSIHKKTIEYIDQRTKDTYLLCLYPSQQMAKDFSQHRINLFFLNLHYTLHICTWIMSLLPDQETQNFLGIQSYQSWNGFKLSLHSERWTRSAFNVRTIQMVCICRKRNWK